MTRRLPARLRNLILAVIIAVLPLVTVVARPVTVHAAAVASQAACTKTTFLGFPTWYKYLNLNTECQVVNFTLPQIWLIGLAIVDILLRLIGIVAVAFIIYGGFRFIVSQGDPEAAKTARLTIINAFVGLIIAIIASGIVAFVANTFK